MQFGDVDGLVERAAVGHGAVQWDLGFDAFRTLTVSLEPDVEGVALEVGQDEAGFVGGDE